MDSSTFCKGASLCFCLTYDMCDNYKYSAPSKHDAGWNNEMVKSLTQSISIPCCNTAKCGTHCKMWVHMQGTVEGQLDVIIMFSRIGQIISYLRFYTEGAFDGAAGCCIGSETSGMF